MLDRDILDRDHYVDKGPLTPGVLDDIRNWDSLKSITLEYDRTLDDERGFYIYSCNYPFLSGDYPLQFMGGETSLDCDGLRGFTLRNVTASTTRKIVTIQREFRDWMNRKMRAFVLKELQRRLGTKDLLHDIVTC
jgi:hypothetical protein